MKYVLCRPEGGLNDIFCRIWVCAQYTAATDRILLIDTETTGFNESFANYFTPRFSNIRIVQDKECLEALRGLSVFPHLSSSLSEYRAEYKDGLNYCEAGSNRQLQFYMALTYDQDVLLYHACGGGDWGHAAFQLFTMTSSIKEKIDVAMKLIPQPYFGIHIRDTDFKTNFLDFVRKIKPQLEYKTVYVATDSLNALLITAEELKGFSVINLSRVLSTNGNPIHMFNVHDKNTWQRSLINEQSIVDLIILANASKMYYSSGSDGRVSGFSTLAQNIHRMKREAVI